MAYNDGIA